MQKEDVEEYNSEDIIDSISEQIFHWRCIADKLEQELWLAEYNMKKLKQMLSKEMEKNTHFISYKVENGFNKTNR
jgi:hypothetical protein